MLALEGRNCVTTDTWYLCLFFPCVVMGRAECSCAGAAPTHSVLVPVQGMLETIKAVVLLLGPIFCLRMTLGLLRERYPG